MASKTWQIQVAKQQFSRLVRAAEAGDPQIVSRHGEPVVVVIDVASYRSSRPGFIPLKDFLLGAPDLGQLDIPERVVEDRVR